MDPRQPDPAQLLRTLDAHYDAMPPVAAMRLAGAELDGDTLRLGTPLSAHVNDKGCAFGGSLVSLMTLAGWGLVTLQLARAGTPCEVFVADSRVRYLKPLFADLQAEAMLADGAAWPAFHAELAQRGRAAVQIACRVRLPEGGNAALCESRYVAIAKG